MEFKETFEKKIEVLLNKIVISIVIFHESSVQNWLPIQIPILILCLLSKIVNIQVICKKTSKILVNHEKAYDDLSCVQWKPTNSSFLVNNTLKNTCGFW